MDRKYLSLNQRRCLLPDGEPFPYPIFEWMRKLQPQNLKNSRAEEFAFAS
jgi:hypothetical protein